MAQIALLKDEVKKAHLLADAKKKAMNVVQDYDKETDWNYVQIELPAEAPGENVSVVVLEVKG